MAEFLGDLRDHWNDGYWWADHELLLTALMGLIMLAFHGVRLWMDRKWGTVADG